MASEQKYDVMILDDTEENIDILVEALDEMYEIQVATNGEEALDFIFENPPDLILLDIMMPGMDGYEVCQRLKDNATTRHIPIIFLSALTEVHEKIRGFSLGASDFITKPFHIDEIHARVKVQLGLYEEKRQLLLENQRLLGERGRGRLADDDLVSEVKGLIEQGESEYVEFKSTLRWDIRNSRKDMAIELAWLRGIVAFLNSNGGKILIGVADDGSITGLENDGFENDDKCLLHVNNRIKDNIGLEFAPHIDFKLVEIEQKKIVLIHCRASKEPVFLTQGKSEAFYIRVGPGNRILQPRQILTYVMEKKKAL